MLNTHNIYFRYDAENEFHLPDLSLKGGQNLLILGQSGSGKTTLLNILGGLLKPINGEVIIDNTSIYKLYESKLDKFRGNNIGIVFQKPHIITALTVRENLQLAAYFAHSQSGDRIDYILNELDIGHKAQSKIQHLSEGEAQRVSIARALVNSPKIILADEPTSSLDDVNSHRVMELLMEQAGKMDAVLIVVTHDQRVKNHISNRITVGVKK
ncbi:ABC transporter ATP-binding protein [Anditalea andensis]|uniref:ABC transporter ATP-binding protein n=1 Tax=Anditalea andensis TaxID=1048983 RepID=A0A074LKP4_9BACT|nr:ATP-binding cassette domain-containing protein [Anditalea andensis]KEO74417.1 ABC transporter ATP-binding protein [Anditalea andensis]